MRGLTIAYIWMSGGGGGFGTYNYLFLGYKIAHATGRYGVNIYMDIDGVTAPVCELFDSVEVKDIAVELVRSYFFMADSLSKRKPASYLDKLVGSPFTG